MLDYIFYLPVPKVPAIELVVSFSCFIGWSRRAVTLSVVRALCPVLGTQRWAEPYQVPTASGMDGCEAVTHTCNCNNRLKKKKRSTRCCGAARRCLTGMLDWLTQGSWVWAGVLLLGLSPQSGCAARRLVGFEGVGRPLPSHEGKWWSCLEWWAWMCGRRQVGWGGFHRLTW